MIGALTTQTVALRGIVARDLRQMRRYKSVYFLMLGSAITVPVMYYAQSLGFAGDSPEAEARFAGLAGTSEVAGFLYLGWAVYMWVTVILYGPATALRTERLRGTFEMVLLTPVRRSTLLVGASIAPMVPTAIMFAVVLFFMWGSLGVSVPGTGVLLLVAVVLVSTPALISIGMLLSSLTVLSRDSDGAVSIAQAVVGVLCGVTYPLAVLPEPLQWFSQLLPPTQTITLLRESVLGGSAPASAGARVAFLLVAAVICFLLARVALRRALVYARRTGRLGQF